jgi:hypothetical protein
MDTSILKLPIPSARGDMRNTTEKEFPAGRKREARDINTYEPFDNDIWFPTVNH